MWTTCPAARSSSAKSTQPDVSPCTWWKSSTSAMWVAQHTGTVSRLRGRVPQTTKTPAEIELMRTAGSIVREAHEAAAAVVGAGVTTAEIDAAVEQVITARGGEQLFKGQ